MIIHHNALDCLLLLKATLVLVGWFLTVTIYWFAYTVTGRISAALPPTVICDSRAEKFCLPILA
jgi:hypothetical protein